MSGNMLSAHFRRIFEDSLTTVQQHQAVDALKDYIAELKDGTDEQRCDLGVLEYDDVDPDVIEHKVQAALDKCYWQLVMFLRVRTRFSSRPLAGSTLRRGQCYHRALAVILHGTASG